MLTPALSAAVFGDDIVDTAVKAGKFNTLAAALQAADLVETVKGKGPFTVFAPTDEAFAKLPLSLSYAEPDASFADSVARRSEAVLHWAEPLHWAVPKQ